MRKSPISLFSHLTRQRLKSSAPLLSRNYISDRAASSSSSPLVSPTRFRPCTVTHGLFFKSSQFQENPSRNMNTLVERSPQVSSRQRKSMEKSELEETFESAQTSEEMLKAFKNMESAFDERELGLASLKVGLKLDQEGEDPEKTLSFATRALKALDRDDKPSFPVAMALQLLGSANYSLKRFSGSLGYLNMANRALGRLEEEGFDVRDIRPVLHAVQLELANVKTAMGRREEALGNLRKCLEIKELMLEKDSTELGKANRDLAEAYVALLNFKDALGFSTNPIALIKSNFLSAQSKLQIILEPYLWKDKRVSDDHTEESVGGFFQRHFGEEVVDYLIDPFVAGTSAGDPESLSMRHSFPDIWNIEKRFGSVISGAIKSKLSASKGKSGQTKGSVEKGKHQRGSFSFHGGMQTLTDILCNQLEKDELKLNSKVLSLSYSQGGNSALQNWSVSRVADNDKHSQSLSVDAVIMTAPLCNVKEMKITKRGTRFPLDFIPEVLYMPLSVIITTFKKENVKRPLEGFGVLVPSKEQKNGLKTLGTLFSSMMFPDRAPSDLYLYTTFVGGSRNKELAKASTDELKQIVTSDIRHLLGAEGEPTFVNHFYWSKAFPLYGRDYDSVIEAIENMEKNLPGFFYAGNHRGGLSVGKSIASGCKAAELVISYLESPSDEKTRHKG